jgi:hypothetical protein
MVKAKNCVVLLVVLSLILGTVPAYSQSNPYQNCTATVSFLPSASNVCNGGRYDVYLTTQNTPHPVTNYDVGVLTGTGYCAWTYPLCDGMGQSVSEEIPAVVSLTAMVTPATGAITITGVVTNPTLVSDGNCYCSDIDPSGYQHLDDGPSSSPPVIINANCS